MTSVRNVAVFGVALASAAGVGTAARPVAALSPAAGYALGVTVFAALLWLTGAIPLSLTALAIPVLLTAFGVVPDFGDAVTGFADPVIFLLLAGFVLAEALRIHGVDRRVAYYILLSVGTSPRRLVLALMVATAVLSMIISNTATTAMMVPIAVGLVGEVTTVVSADDAEPETPATARSESPSNFQLAALLGVAYAASLGGVGTLVGTPPNAIVVGQLGELLDYHVSFADWLLVGLPMVVVTLPVAWVLLTFVVYPPQVGDVSAARASARRGLADAGELSPPRAVPSPSSSPRRPAGCLAAWDFWSARPSRPPSTPPCSAARAPPSSGRRGIRACSTTSSSGWRPSSRSCSPAPPRGTTCWTSTGRRSSSSAAASRSRTRW